MTRPAAFRATYSDLRFIKTRKVAQIVLEMPLESADAFLAAFGTPNPSEEKWCAIARLVDHDDKPQTEHEHKPWDSLRPSAQAAIRCDDPMFWQFLSVSNKDQAAENVRRSCDVPSRSQLDRSYDARSKWEAMDEAFMEWKRLRKL